MENKTTTEFEGQLAVLERSETVVCHCCAVKIKKEDSIRVFGTWVDNGKLREWLGYYCGECWLARGGPLHRKFH